MTTGFARFRALLALAFAVRPSARQKEARTLLSHLEMRASEGGG